MDNILQKGDKVTANKNNVNNRYDAIIPKTIFHYTSFEKFKCILQYGTWRFQLSTQSNDLLDTTYIVDIIKKLEIQKNLTDDHRKLLEMLIGYFKRDVYERQFLSYVTCFTDKSDSRLLWDAYTINRPITNLDDVRDYNGVCIGVNRDKLLNTLQSKKPEYCVIRFIRTAVPVLSGRRFRSYPDADSGLIRTAVRRHPDG